MSLHDGITQVRQLQKELILFNIDPGDPFGEHLTTYFDTQNVEIRTARTSAGRPAGVAVLSTNEKVLGRFDVEMLRELVDDVPARPSTVGVADAEYEELLTHLKETTFTSYDTEQMLYVSREIEDRARRVGQGTIHTGFQQCSLMAEQRAIYADLARRGLDVHAYGVPDIAPPALDDVQCHLTATDEIAETWFVVFDGGSDKSQRSALLAEERAQNNFYGVWTYDPTIVDGVLSYLEQTYGQPETSSRRSEL